MGAHRPDLPSGHARAVRSRTRGLWPAEPFDAADTSDVCHPDHYLATAGSWVEQVLRADFARYHQLAAAAARADSPAEIDALTTRTAAIEGPWLEREGSWARAWQHAVAAREDWIRAPEAMSGRLGALEEERSRGWLTVTDLELRTLHQLRELTTTDSRDPDHSPSEPADPIDRDGAQIITAALGPELLPRHAADTAASDTFDSSVGSEQALDDGPGR